MSRRLSYVLRHAPQSIGVSLDRAGWVDVDTLLAALRAHGLSLSREQLSDIVRTNDKQRFAFDEAGTRIRANQGHSIPVDLGYTPRRPPPVLYHGTPVRSIDAILAHGLQPRGRHAVHLSTDIATARAVGARRGQHAVLRVDAAGMAADGAVFTCSANGVWLVAGVPPGYLSLVT